MTSKEHLIAVLGVLWAACSAGPVEAGNPSAQSKVDSKWSDAFAARSGWENNVNWWGGVLLGAKSPPTGSFNLEYRHWFNGGGGPVWTTHATPNKPEQQFWGTSPNITDYRQTIHGNSTAESWWEIDPYVGGILAPTRGGYYAKYYTYSKADAVYPSDFSAHSRTRILDPWIYVHPEDDPDHPVDEPLDPEGRWMVGIDVAGFGSLVTAPGQHAYWEADYELDLDGMGTISALNIVLSDTGTTVSADPRMMLFLNGQFVTPIQVAKALDGYRASSGWEISPSFDFDGFQPENLDHLSEVFHLRAGLFLDSSVRRATLHTAHASAFDDPDVPEPGTLMLLCAGSFLLKRRTLLR